MKVLRWMSPDPVTASPDDTVDDVRERMAYYGVHHLPVTRAGRLVGILSDRDLWGDAGSDANGGRRVDEVMSEAPHTVGEATEIHEAARRMLEARINALPVLDVDGELVGMITTTDCLLAMLELDHDEV